MTFKEIITAQSLFKHFTLYIVTGVILLSGFSAHGDEIAKKKETLQQVKQQISETASEIKEKKHKERTLLQQLDQLEQQMANSDAAVRYASRALAEAKEKIASLEEKITRYESILKRSQKDVEQRLRTLYTSGDITSLRLIFSTETPLQLAENLDFLSRIAAHDKKLLSSYRQQTRQLQRARLNLHNELTRQEQALAEKQQHKQTLEKNKTRKAQLVTQIKRDRQALKHRLTQLEERSKNLSALVSKLKQDKQNAAFVPTNQPFISAKGKIPWPSSGAVREGFGTHKDRTFGTKYKSNGLEIAAVPGTPIKAIWPGKVVFSSPFKGYGNLIIIDHGSQYYSLYAQVINLKHAVGTIVNAGDVIATSGYEQRDSYHLEIRHRGTPVDPKDWLRPRNG
ncbi:peptidoglycan DD-metalloendopeptidase family protein [uncultured Desulfuromonas sp.]|uniref:murein hydrolase activator EnvC family protein n=1 Tax=uncultured Desulfuromonas sp. TaxID=181013 RepID=UPI002AABCA9C|nr:peptidoglycan DD-metalloendopeptidase family protein [uncultured Desulfuromonas sp.]